MKNNHRTSFQTTILPVLLLQNTMLRSQNSLISKRCFFNNLKHLSNQDAIVGTQIAPLSRNQGPNNSTLNAKLGFTSQSFNALIQNFELMSKNCHVCGSTLYKQYRAKVNQLEKYMIFFENQKKKLEDKEKQLVEKLKTLRFKTVPVSQSETQTETVVDSLIRKQIMDIKSIQERNEAMQKQARQQQNKENYLRYMEEIINNRQTDLDRRQAELDEMDRNLSAEDCRFKTEPLNHLIDSKRMYQYFSILKDRIYDAVLKYESGEPSILKLLQNHPLYDLFQKYEQNNINPKLKFQILKLLEINTLEQRYKLEVCEDYFYNESSKIQELKRELEEKNIKFIQLNSYEHFLDRYRQLLDQRQDSLNERVTLFKQQVRVVMQYLDIKSSPLDNSELSSSFSFLQHIDKDMKGNSSGRGRIFTLRQRTSNIIQQYKSMKPQLEKQFLSQKINKMKQGYESQLCQLKRINDLEQQVESLKSQLNVSQNSLLNKHRQFNKENKMDQMNHKNNLLTDHPEKDFEKVLEQAAKKKKMIDALSRMFKHSFSRNIRNTNLNKGFAWLVWRSRQYDLEAYDKVKQLVAEQYQDHQEQLWRRKSNALKKQKLFPYKSLSLNRKQFLEQFFDYERKQFFKDRLKALLLSITRNKIRKQRMIFIVHFHRFVRNTMLTNIPRLKLQKLQQAKPPINSKNQTDKTSSRALKPQNMQTNSRTTLSFDSNNTKRSSKVREQSSTKQCPIDKNSERNQYQRRFRKMLACGKLSHVFKDVTNRTKENFNKFFMILKDNYHNSKINQIESLVDQISFDNNMFVTKFNICQSSLASKMSLLEQFLTIAPK